MQNSTTYSPWLHRFARLTVGATFLLIVIGGIVTSTESGLAVPDWPTTFGYNMFLYPLSEMVGGVLYEHSHRLMGSFVGLLTVVLFIMLWAKKSSMWLRWLGCIALVGVIVQGVLGGLRVTQLSLVLAIVHACLAQAFFALLCGIAWFTSRDWLNTAPRDNPSGNLPAKKLRRLSLITTCLIYVQLIFGAILRHTGSRLELHLLFAFLVTLHIFLIARRIWQEEVLFRSVSALIGLLAVQLLLGTGAFFVKFTTLGETMAVALTVAITTGHVAFGALMLVMSFVLTLKIYRLTAASTISSESQEVIATADGELV